MLKATAQKFRDITIVRCQGRIVVGENVATLRDAVLGQTTANMLVLDLAHVDRIDAGGLGILLSLREWAYANAIRFKLMNVINHVDRVIRLTKLDRVFEFWSVADIVCLLHLEPMPGTTDVRSFRGFENAALRVPPAA